LYFHYLRLAFHSLFAYRADFLIGSLGFLLSTGALLFTLFLIFQFTESIGGWNLWQAVFLFAFTTLARALWETFMYNMSFLGKKVRDGSLDCLLLRPLDPLFQLIAEKINPDTIGEVIFNAILVGICLKRFGMLDYPGTMLMFGGLLISAVFIFAAIHLFVNTLAFWITQTDGLNFIIWSLDDFLEYPLSIYPKWFVRLFTYVIPFGFVGYYPVSWLLGKTPAPEGWICLVAGPVFFLLAYAFWRVGLGRYQSTGS
jgi:ABC-2 type transport system permease protein